MKLSWTFKRAMGKSYLWVPLILTLIISMTPAIVPVHAGHTNEHFWVEPAVKSGEAVDTLFNVSIWVENAWDMVGWAMSVHVDPDVLEVMNAYEGPFISDFVDWWNSVYAPNPWDEKLEYDFFPNGSAIDKEGGYIIDTDCMIKKYHRIAVGEAANGTGMLCKYEFKSKNLTAYSLIDLFDVRVYDHTQELEIENVTDGHYNEPPAGGDVAVTAVVPVKPCSTVPGAVHPIDYAFPTWGDKPLNITVTVENKDAASATFDVNASYVNATGSYLIGTQTKTLGGSATENVTFSWNVSAVALGIYNITAEAVLEGDTYPDDNSLTYSRVKIKLPGDANGDAIVDVSDFAALGKSWFKGCDESNYDPTVDFNSDCFIDVSDFATLGKWWFKTTDAYTAED